MKQEERQSYLCNLACLVVATNERDAIRVSHLEKSKPQISIGHHKQTQKIHRNKKKRLAFCTNAL